MNQKNTRIEIRVDEAGKLLLEKAAELRGQSLSSFVLSVVLPEARSILDAYEGTRLSRTDWEALDALLANPPKPNRKLLTAVKKFARQVTVEHGG
ncbi:MAG: DUF1778 domain-containing protein [Bacteroidetes bacterium]|nr:DUF1778 domain-containing protein [Bacteroidota bacterium]